MVIEDKLFDIEMGKILERGDIVLSPDSYVSLLRRNRYLEKHNEVLLKALVNTEMYNPIKVYIENKEVK